VNREFSTGSEKNGKSENRLAITQATVNEKRYCSISFIRESESFIRFIELKKGIEKDYLFSSFTLFNKYKVLPMSRKVSPPDIGDLVPPVASSGLGGLRAFPPELQLFCFEKLLFLKFPLLLVDEGFSPSANTKLGKIKRNNKAVIYFVTLTLIG
jgi:hypothetical protein